MLWLNYDITGHIFMDFYFVLIALGEGYRGKTTEIFDWVSKTLLIDCEWIMEKMICPSQE
jgi:hypothetical protein